MQRSLDAYAQVVGDNAIHQLQQLAKKLAGATVVHVNSTRSGGGVAEILDWLIPLKNELGIDTTWEVIEGNASFFRTTKAFHNGLQGTVTALTPSMLQAYEETVAANAERLRPLLEQADFVFIHDPQPALLHDLCPGRRGKWIWRCHIDASHPQRKVWKYLRNKVKNYDASIFSMPEFAQALPHPQFLIAPSIDPLSEKNCSLTSSEINQTLARYGIPQDIPLFTQVSRFDRFKDPLGVIEAFKLLRDIPEPHLVLAGGGASDDPEGTEVLREVQAVAGEDPRIHVLLLPSDAHRTINALQRAATVILQKSLQEGFGLTVTEAMWKGKPVIAGNVGGIRLQVHNFYTGFRVDTPEGAALRLRWLLRRPDQIELLGEIARQFVKENFLLTRHLREYLTLMLTLRGGPTNHLHTY